ncbi:MAG: hypothetical protein V4510_06205 [bacterium]
MKTEFSVVYLNDVPVTLTGDQARPRLSRVVRDGGGQPDDVEVRWLTKASDPTGPLLHPEAVIDRTANPTQPIYLWSVARRALHDAETAATPGTRQQEATTSQPDPAIEQLGLVPPALQTPDPIADDPITVRLFRGERAAEAQALAEAEAEQRQEEQREGEGIQQDEQEALDEAEQDGDMYG